MRRSLIVLSGLLLPGCSSLPAALGGEDMSSVGRGRAFAERQCAHCHAITPDGTSPRSDAPSFAAVRLRYNALSLMREFEAIEEVGHYGMPPLHTEVSDRRDLIDYIESLGR